MPISACICSRGQRGAVMLVLAQEAPVGNWAREFSTTGRRTRKPIPQRYNLIDLRRGLELCEIQWALVVEQHPFYQSQAEHRCAPTMLPHESNKHAAQQGDCSEIGMKRTRDNGVPLSYPGSFTVLFIRSIRAQGIYVCACCMLC